MYEAGQIVRLHRIPGLWNINGNEDGLPGFRLLSPFAVVVEGQEESFSAFIHYDYGHGTAEHYQRYTGCQGAVTGIGPVIAEAAQQNRDRILAEEAANELSASVRERTALIESLRDDLAAARTQIDAQTDDFETIQDFMLNTVKREQGWCDDGTREVVDRLNEKLSTFHFEFMEWFTVPMEVTGTISKTIRVRVKAPSLDDAVTAVRDASVSEADQMIEDDEDCSYSSCDDVLTNAATCVNFEDIIIAYPR